MSFYLEKLEPLVRRTYRHKRPRLTFFCPLCRSERSMVHNFRLSFLNYLQILFVSSLFIWGLYPWMEFKSFFVFFLVWAIFDWVKRSVYRRELPCPHCGFDASWYKRDVKKARQLVEDFWKEQESVPGHTPKEGTPETTTISVQ